MKCNRLLLIALTIIFSMFMYTVLARGVNIVDVHGEFVIIRKNCIRRCPYGVMNTEGDLLYPLTYIGYQFVEDKLILFNKKSLYVMNQSQPNKIIKTVNDYQLKAKFNDYFVYYSAELDRDILIGEKIIEMDSSYTGYIESYRSDLLNEDKLFHNGYAIIDQDGKKGFIDIDGNVTLEPKYHRLSGYSNEGLSIACEGNKFDYFSNPLDCGLINKEGKETTSFIYDFHKYEYKILDYMFYIDEANDVMIKKQGEYYGLVKKSDNSITIPFEFDEIKQYNNELHQDRVNSSQKPTPYFLVRKGDKWGIYHKDGTLIVKPIHDRFLSIQLNTVEKEDEIIIAEKDGFRGVYDMQGHLIVDFNYNEINRFSRYNYPSYYSRSEFKTSIYQVRKGEVWGYLDKQGNQLTDLLYDRAWVYCNVLLVDKDETAYEVDYIERTPSYKKDYCSVKYEYSHFLTSDQEVLYHNNGNIYHINQEAKETLLYNRLFNVSIDSLFSLLFSIPLGFLSTLFVVYILPYPIVVIKKRNKEIEELRRRLDL